MKFETEHLLCRAFQDFVGGREVPWDIYPETNEWDLLCVDESDRRLGIQAKLQDAPLAVAQAVECLKHGKADTGAILMPSVSESIRRLCKATRIGWIVPVGLDDNGGTLFQIELPRMVIDKESARPKLPPMKPEVPAGVPSPRKFTNNTMKELRLCAIFRRKGFVNTKDFQSVGLRTTFLPDWLYRKSWNRFEQVIGSSLPDEFHPTASAAAALEVQ